MKVNINQTFTYITSKIASMPKIAIILGSGLGGFSDLLEKKRIIPTAEIPHFPRSTVEGHHGNFIFGTYDGTPIIALQGRTHFYEGYSQEEITLALDVFKKLSIKLIIVTNAAGAISNRLHPGDLMLITDQIHFMFSSPLIGSSKERDNPFPDMSDPYTKSYHELIETIALKKNIPLKRGVLFATTGPTYETAAEVKMIKRMGGDAGSMSTSPEVIAAAANGMDVIGISCITNYATGRTDQKLSHKEVTATANNVQESFIKLVSGIITQVSDSYSTK